MLRNWINILPLFIVKQIARKNCELVYIGGKHYYTATKGVLVEWEPPS